MELCEFYKNLTCIESLKEISNSAHYTPLPDEWYILVTDIINSTKAIENGAYKEVNMIGALTIVSILNIDKNLDIPFVFGGDGAFILIPPRIMEHSKQALLAVEKIAKDAYNLNLRIALIPIEDIYQQNKQLLITKYAISKDYTQAIIKGGGLELADSLLKTSTKYTIDESIDESFEVDTSGLECRWENVKSPKDETLSILIKAKDETYYTTILENLDLILGDFQTRHPLSKQNTQLSFNNSVLNKEASLFTQNKFLKLLIIYKLKIENLLGKFLMKFHIGKWGEYKDRVISTSDTEKFDDMLRMVVSTDFAQTKKLQEYLEKEYQEGNLTYGIHQSDSSLMTCLIFERHGKHIHFVDASNGGYAIAAKGLKKRALSL